MCFVNTVLNYVIVIPKLVYKKQSFYCIQLLWTAFVLLSLVGGRWKPCGGVEGMPSSTLMPGLWRTGRGKACLWTSSYPGPWRKWATSFKATWKRERTQQRAEPAPAGTWLRLRTRTRLRVWTTSGTEWDRETEEESDQETGLRRGQGKRRKRQHGYSSETGGQSCF